MEITRTEKEVIIKLPLSVDTEDLQELVDYLSYKEQLQPPHKRSNLM